MIIAFDAKRLFNNFTGLGNYSRTLLRDLQHYHPEHEYHLFTPRVTKNSETEYFFDKDKFTIHKPGFNNPFWRTLGMSGPINALKPDIFHGLSHELPFGLDPKISTVVSFHDLIYEKYPDQFGPINSRIYSWKYKSSVRRAAHVVAISESTKSDLIEMYQTPTEKISVIYQSCHDTYKTQEPSTENVLPEGLKDYFLYVGSIIERKGLLQTMIAYGMLPKEKRKPFVIIGQGDRKYLEQVKGMVQFYGLQKDVFFIERLSNHQLVSIYDHAYALVFASIYEGFGIPVIESLFRQKPVITSTLSSLPEAAGPGAILINPYEPNDIAKAMVDIQDPRIYDACADAGYKYVINKFDSEEIARQWIELYTSLTNPM